MPKKPAQNSPPDDAISKVETPDSKSLPQVSAAELLSFLKQTRGVQTWTEKEMAKALQIGLPEAKQGIIVLQLQGYIEPAGRQESGELQNKAIWSPVPIAPIHSTER